MGKHNPSDAVRKASAAVRSSARAEYNNAINAAAQTRSEAFKAADKAKWEDEDYRAASAAWWSAYQALCAAQNKAEAKCQIAERAANEAFNEVARTSRTKRKKTRKAQLKVMHNYFETSDEDRAVSLLTALAEGTNEV